MAWPHPDERGVAVPFFCIEMAGVIQKRRQGVINMNTSEIEEIWDIIDRSLMEKNYIVIDGNNDSIFIKSLKTNKEYEIVIKCFD